MSRQSLGKDNLLHISSHALAMYAQEGGQVSIQVTSSGLHILLKEIKQHEPALHQSFVDLILEKGDEDGT